MTSPTYNKTYAYQLLEVFAQQFTSQFSTQINTARLDGLSKPAFQVLKGLADGFDDPSNVDKIARIQKLTDETKGIMANNINKIIVNNSNVEQLETMAEILNDDATEFHTNATTIKKQARSKQQKNQGHHHWSLVVPFVAVIIIIVLKC
eukprot:gnl/Chilomastix_caulleri/1257.p1 GENE.gnl/Chilomastix_caulleri/1257~~gnl/Chilomastix_caulleri/1257.p1  ORF type:complete len:149 (+),score=29.53 gnl/Chilomastix_caulleri/1257:257-703(+)